MTGHLVPATALPAWDALNLALIDYRPPCTSSPDQWQSIDPDAVRAATAGCSRCRVLAACDAYATVARESVGTWAGVNRDCRSPSTDTHSTHPTKRGDTE